MKLLLTKELPWLVLAVYLAAIPALSGAETAGETPWYQFEAIIFERISAGAGGTEFWPFDPGKPSQLNAIPILDMRPLSEAEAQDAHAYRLLPSSEWQLTEHQARLRRSRNYRPLLQLAWRQPMAEPDTAQPLYFDVTSSKGAQLTGTLKVGLKRYLHLEADLLLQRPATAATDRGTGGTLGTGLQSYRMQSNRRMRSEELHYLDHPVLGILILASKFEPPKPEQPASAETPAAPAPPVETTQPIETPALPISESTNQ